MINITEDIHSLTEFKKNTNDFIFDLKKTGRPSVLTVNGRAELVVMDANAYQKIQQQLRFDDNILEINNSIKDFESGKFSSAKDVFDELRQRTNKPKKLKNHQK